MTERDKTHAQKDAWHSSTQRSHSNVSLPRGASYELLRWKRRGCIIERRYFLSGARKVTLFPNLLAEVAVYQVSGSGR